MYKAITIGKVTLAANTFRLGAKKISPVYRSGYRQWKADINSNYSLVLWRFRLILSFAKEQSDCCGG